VDVGRPIVTNGEFVLWRSCAKVREPIELPFGVMSRIIPGKGAGGFGVFSPLV